MDTYVFFFCHECMVRVLMRPSLAGSFSLIFHLSNAKKKIQGSCPFHSGDILNRLSLASLQL